MLSARSIAGLSMLFRCQPIKQGRQHVTVDVVDSHHSLLAWPAGPHKPRKPRSKDLAKKINDEPRNDSKRLANRLEAIARHRTGVPWWQRV